MDRYVELIRINLIILSRSVFVRRIKLTVCELAYEISVDSPSFYLYE